MNYYLISTKGMLKYDPFVQKYPHHLALAQYLLRDGEWADMVRKLCMTTEVILDNGAYEGELCEDINAYAALTARLKPWCVVLPDLVGESNLLSREVAMDALVTIQDTGYAGQYMYVPQGRTKEEVLEEFQWAFAAFPGSIIGMGKCYELWGPTEADRAGMFLEIAALRKFNKKQIHILGARYDAPEYTFQAYPNVIGIDTLKPARRAYLTADKHDTRKVPHDKPVAVRTEYLVNEIHAFCHAYGLNLDWWSPTEVY